MALIFVYDTVDVDFLSCEIQVRDITVYIQAQKALSNMSDSDEIRSGSVLPMPPQPASSTKARRSSKMNRRRN